MTGTRNPTKEIDHEAHRIGRLARQSEAGDGLAQHGGGALHDTPYGFSSRFENGAGTNPRS